MWMKFVRQQKGSKGFERCILSCFSFAEKENFLLCAPFLEGEGGAGLENISVKLSKALREQTRILGIVNQLYNMRAKLKAD